MTDEYRGTLHPVPDEQREGPDDFRRLAVNARLAAFGDSNDDEIDALLDALEAAERIILGGRLEVEEPDDD